MEISHVIRGDDHLVQHAAASSLLQRSGVDAAGVCPSVDDFGARRSAAVQTARRHRGRGISGRGLPARGHAQLFGPLGVVDGRQPGPFHPRRTETKFTVERCGKSPAIFDPNKLIWMNGEYIRKMPIPELVDRAMPFIKKAGFLNGHEEERRSEIEAAVALEHEKIKHLTDVPGLIDFFFKDVVYDPASVEKVLKKTRRRGCFKGRCFRRLRRSPTLPPRPRKKPPKRSRFNGGLKMPRFIIRCECLSPANPRAQPVPYVGSFGT
jgi:nondiscriminating glutamyl-tRNA synthetase